MGRARYHVYRNDGTGSYAAGQTRASATAPSAHRGSMYLGTSGNAATWRFVGIVRTNGSTNFVDSTTQRFVRSYYNQPETYLINVFTADRTRNGTPFDEITRKYDAKWFFSDDEITATINGSITFGTAVPGRAGVAIGINSTTTESGAATASIVNSAGSDWPADSLVSRRRYQGSVTPMLQCLLIPTPRLPTRSSTPLLQVGTQRVGVG